ncbi:putative polarized growth protein (Boi2) [Aspergillus saccharolyticus JOP 1030-1]|uniref:Polarized growth protein Boi2 n=1 Tax=Aspergillus saccharolyticus JOP 1030-1 TaxID=1450539 RepID=A0A318Z3D8_9EURO|nr:polarized growth protein Boi2 [Aspergillus saccharolyticus JOP 1030-1]PYH40914.1 polarized growth protein Boi2 [Aspergillus saccharolyticus JOP 1030-1]
MALAAPPRGVIPGDLLLVVHDFDARGPDELTLRRGEKIELVELDEGFGDGWYLGKELTTGSTGLFPGVYTTAAPKIRTRPPTETTVQATAEHPTEIDGTTLDAEFVPRSGDSTPQVSRHTSISDLHAPEVPRSPPQQQQPQQRSASSPLPAAKISLEIRQALEGQHRNGQDSPVMNETLSVIDEHITDLSTPRHSVADREPSVLNDSASEYSSHLDHRRSYINGHETDEEEERQPQEAQVRRWSPAYTARQLRQLGIENKHCDIFEEQEISGDVLLDMNQDFLFMKEFDFGVMGRRLKTWHKIRTFQDQVKVSPKAPSPAVSPTLPRSSLVAGPGSPERTRSRAGQTAPLLPRIPTLRTSNTPHPRLVGNTGPSTGSSSPIPSQAPSYMDHSRRPSAASVREINHSRRHSSIDATTRYSGVVDGSPGPTQRGSFDRAWSLSTGPQQRLPTRPGTSAGTSTANSPAFETGFVHTGGHRANESNGSDTTAATPDDLDRGYFSGPEGDTRKHRRLLQKRQSAAGSADARISPVPGEPLRVSKRHSRISSMDSIREKAVQPIAPPNKSFTAPAPKGRLRSLSTRLVDRRTPQSAPVSAIEDRSGGSNLFGPLFGGKSESDTSRSSQQPAKTGAQKFRRVVGIRTMSDVVNKGVDTTAAPPSPVRDRDPAPARTGSTTPSTTKSSERLSTDGSGKATESGLWPRSRPSVKTGSKSKKDTSAYMRGLEKKSPQEQMTGCDYVGWMKKKSPNLITTWKPRLFVLRGRRLSYYYSEQDTEERGLIDITAHRVLRADHDPMIALHATITGSTGSPTAPAPSVQLADGSSSSDPIPTSEAPRVSKSGNEGPFFFKLVPPKSGSSRTVQFTKPAVHYFQVDNVQEGRRWMAALMKATIERDMDLPIETTNKQRTISLKEAQLMNQRPPALMAGTAAGAEGAAPEATATEDASSKAPSEPTEGKTTGAETEDAPEERGLMIKGLDLDGQRASSDSKEGVQLSKPLGDVDTDPASLVPESMRDSQ